MGEGRKKAKESRVVPHPKLNPGCATVYINSHCHQLTITVICHRPVQLSMDIYLCPFL